MNHYQPGLHFIGDIDSQNEFALRDTASCKILLDRLINLHGLTKVGEVYHSFDGAGFTATICLTESHIAIHTWPEYGKVTFDVFLSNFRHNNDQKGESIFKDIADHFSAIHIDKKLIRR